MSSYDELIKANKTLGDMNITIGGISNESTVIKHHTSAFVSLLDGDEYVWVVDDGTSQYEIQRIVFNLSFTEAGADNVRGVGDVLLVDVRISPTFLLDNGVDPISSAHVSKKAIITNKNETIIIEPSGEGKVEISVKCKTLQSSILLGMTCDLEVIE